MSRAASSRTFSHKEKVQCFLAAKSSLLTHNLSEDEITWAANFVTAQYLKQTPGFTREKLVMFLTYSRRQGLCRFALSYNRELDQAIKEGYSAYQNKTTGGTEYLLEILEGQNTMFVELYDNDELTARQREHLMRILSRELQTTSRLLTEGKFVDFEKERFSCYQDTCLDNNDPMEQDPIRKIFQFHENVPDVFCMSVKGKPTCFPVLEFVALLTENKIDRLTPDELKIARKKLTKEIAMYRRYLISYSS